MLIMPGMNRQTPQASGHARNGGKEPASAAAVHKDARKDGGKAPGKDAAPPVRA
jgi:hypothetical protein